MVQYTLLFRMFCTNQKLFRASGFLYEDSRKLAADEKRQVRAFIEDLKAGMEPHPEMTNWLAAYLVAEDAREVKEVGFQLFLSLTGFPICAANLALRLRDADDDLYGVHEALYRKTRVTEARLKEIPVTACERYAKTPDFNALAMECVNYLGEHCEERVPDLSPFQVAVERIAQMIK